MKIRFYDNFFTIFIMIKQILLLFVIVSLCKTEGTQWINWNNFAISNPTIIGNYVQPAIPANFKRYSDNSPSQSSYSTRANQYRYTISLFGMTCNLYCGPRSFLSTDSTGKIICQRDYTSNFWGAYQGTFKQSCIPDLDWCSIAGLSGACNPSKYYGTGYAQFDCCYYDATNFNQNFDLTKRAYTTSLYSLRNAE